VCECSVVSVIDWERTYFAASPNDPVYDVKAPREPTAAEIQQFQAEAVDEGYNAWPAVGEQCKKCER
jgi:hypothetical protein